MPAFATTLRAVLLAALAVPALKAVGAPHPAANPRLHEPYEEWTVGRPDQSYLHYYVRAPRGKRADAPVVLFEVGSGCNSQFFIRKGELRNTLFGLLAELAPEAVVAAPEKRGVAFGHYTGNGQDSDCSPEYTSYATWEQRVHDGELTLDALRAQGYTSKRVLLVGHSEGADVVAGIAGERPDVTHVAFLAGGGPTQMFDFAMLERRDGGNPKDVERRVEQLQEDYKAILADPQSTTRKYQGHAFRRWSGFLLHPPVEGLAKSHAKLFLAQGSGDTHVPIESFDYTVMELLRRRHPDMTVRRYPGAGHGFEGKGGPGLDGVFKESLDWFRRS